jgi:peptide chain release factor 3
VAHRLKHEYGVESSYDVVDVTTARWVDCEDAQELEKFRNKNIDRLALDSGGKLAYLAPTLVNLNLASQRWPEVSFSATREH